MQLNRKLMKWILYILTFITLHVVLCCNRDKDKQSAFIARGHSLQSLFLNLKESSSETLTASIKTTYSPMMPRKGVTPRLSAMVALTTAILSCSRGGFIQQWHSKKLADDEDDDVDNKHWDDGGCFCQLAGQTGEGGALHPATLLETQRGMFQSAMKCTNVTGKAPLLIGSPSMWPSCDEGRQRRRQRMIKGSYL